MNPNINPHQFSEIPPEPGQSPIPEGHVRLFHYTSPRNIPAIRARGLLESKARGDGGMGAGNEPSAGVWASSRVPSHDKLYNSPYVEFTAHPNQISGRANTPPRPGEDTHEWESRGNHVIMRGDVDPKQIVAIHEPWHGHARYMERNGGTSAYEHVPTEMNQPEFFDYQRAYGALKRKEEQNP